MEFLDQIANLDGWDWVDAAVESEYFWVVAGGVFGGAKLILREIREKLFGLSTVIYDDDGLEAEGNVDKWRRLMAKSANSLGQEEEKEGFFYRLNKKLDALDAGIGIVANGIMEVWARQVFSWDSKRELARKQKKKVKEINVDSSEIGQGGEQLSDGWSDRRWD